MTFDIAKLNTAMSPNAERALDSVAKALTDTPSAPITALDRYEQSRKAIQIKCNTQAEVAQTLQALGVYKVGADATMALLASGQRAPIKEIDAALLRANVPVSERIQLKTALDRFAKLPK